MRAASSLGLAMVIGLAAPAASLAQDFAFPSFKVREIATNGTAIHVRSGGSGSGCSGSRE